MGRRVTSGAGGHVVILSEAARHLPGHEPLFTRLDTMRRARHAIFYEVDEVSDAELAGAMADAEQAIGLADTAVAGATP